MKTEILTACDQVVAAMANGVYQGAILTLLVGVGLKWFGRSNAATRHGVWLATLVLLLAIIPAHYWLKPPGSGPPAAAREGAAAGNSEIGSVASRVPEPQREGADAVAPWPPRIPGFEYGPITLEGGHEPEAVVPFVSLWQQPGMGRSSRVPAQVMLEPLATDAAFEQASEESDRRPSRRFEPVTWNLASRLGVPRLTGAVLVGAWCALAALRMALLMRRLYQLQRLKAGSVPARPELEDLFQRLKQQLGVGRKVELRVSPAQRCPVVLGFLPPVILLPAAEAARPDTAEMEQILRHELAHVRRGDDWANLIQHCIQATCFFHPAVWWVTRRLALEREIACDDHVLDQGGRRRVYALLLAELANRMKRCPALPAPGVFTNKSQLQQRINMILDTRRNKSPRLAMTRLGFITSAAALLAVFALYSAPRLVLAQTQTPSAEATPLPPTAAIAGSVDEAAVALPPPAAPEAALVAYEGDTPSIPGEESGPKFKLGGPGAPATAPALAAPPTPPTAVAAPVPLGRMAAPPAPPTAVAAPLPLSPMAAPVPLNRLAAPCIPGDTRAPMALPATPGKRYAQTTSKPGDVEQRLERLERMVQSLMAERRPKSAQGEYSRDSAWMNPQEIQKLQETVERQAAQAAEQARAAAQDSKRANRELERSMKEKNAWAFSFNQDSGEKQLEALRLARQGLEREMQKLDTEIRRLEQEHRKLEQEQRRLQQQQPKPAPDQPRRNKTLEDPTSDDGA